MYGLPDWEGIPCGGGGAVGTGGGVVDGVRAWSNRNGGNRATPRGGVTCGEGGMPKEECGGEGPVMGGSVVGVMRL